MTPKLDLTLAAANPKQRAKTSASRADGAFAKALFAKMPTAEKADAKDQHRTMKLGGHLAQFPAHHGVDKGDQRDALSSDQRSNKDDEPSGNPSSLLDLIARQFDRDERRKASASDGVSAGAAQDVSAGDEAAMTAREARAAGPDADSTDALTGETQAALPDKEQPDRARVGAQAAAPADGRKEQPKTPAPSAGDASARPDATGRQAADQVARSEPRNAAPNVQEPRAVQKAADAPAPARSGSDMPAPGQASVQVSTQTQLPPAQTVTAALGADPVWASYFRELPTAGPQPVKSLRIQLNPAELGSVTAHLKASGDVLTVELEVETTDARDHLSSDTDSIVKSLKAVGVDVDKVTVKLADHGAHAADRGDAQLSRGFAGEAGPGSNRERQSNPSGGSEFFDGAPASETGPETRAAREAEGRYI